MVRNGKAYQYAVWCIEENNRKVGIYVKRQAQQWLYIADGKSDEAFVDEQAAEKIEKLLQLMQHPDLGCSMADGLEDYAWFLIIAVLCTKKVDAKNRDIRYYTTALLEIARKNFKTFVSAIIFILLLLIKPPLSRFFSVAPDLSLSSELNTFHHIPVSNFDFIFVVSAFTFAIFPNNVLLLLLSLLVPILEFIEFVVLCPFFNAPNTIDSYFDETADRYDIRFDLADCMEVFTGGKWKSARMEYRDNWYLVDIRAEDLNSLLVRI